MEINNVDFSNSKIKWSSEFGAFNHIIGNHNAFSSVRPSTGHRVRSAGGHSHPLTAIGNVSMINLATEIKSLENVLFLPSIVKNLISVAYVADKDMSLKLVAKGCFICRRQDHFLVAYAKRNCDNALYQLNLSTIVDNRLHQRHHNITDPIKVLNCCPKSNIATTWHSRLGYYHSRGSTSMIQYQTVLGLLTFSGPLSPCKTCLDKQNRKQKFETSSVLRLSDS